MKLLLENLIEKIGYERFCFMVLSIFILSSIGPIKDLYTTLRLIDVVPYAILIVAIRAFFGFCFMGLINYFIDCGVGYISLIFFVVIFG